MLANLMKERTATMKLNGRFVARFAGMAGSAMLGALVTVAIIGGINLAQADNDSNTIHAARSSPVCHMCLSASERDGVAGPRL
jgi:hypothetical protein